MTIPKNRDNSGTALLYIVGPNFVRPSFVGPTISDPAMVEEPEIL